MPKSLPLIASVIISWYFKHRIIFNFHPCSLTNYTEDIKKTVMPIIVASNCQLIRSYMLNTLKSILITQITIGSNNPMISRHSSARLGMLWNPGPGFLLILGHCTAYYHATGWTTQESNVYTQLRMPITYRYLSHSYLISQDKVHSSYTSTLLVWTSSSRSDAIFKLNPHDTVPCFNVTSELCNWVMIQWNISVVYNIVNPLGFGHVSKANIALVHQVSYIRSL